MKIKLKNFSFYRKKEHLSFFLSVLVFSCVSASYGLEPIKSVESKKTTNYLQQQVKGLITDVNGQPIPGVNIVEKGTTNGVQSDFDGGFFISPSNENAVLVFSFVGFLTKEIPIGNQTDITVILEEDISQLDEVVIVGFGSQKSSKVVSSIAQVTAEELKIDQRPVTSGYSALIGAVPGLVLSNNNGSPGAVPNISIRGTSTLNDGTLLIIIDGFEGSLSDIDPQSIESVSVLKDASAVAVYGARGANGVLLVTTKRTNRDEKVAVSYNFSSSIQSKPDLPSTLNSLEYMEFQNTVEPGKWDDTALDLARSGFYPDTNWADELYENTALQQSHNLTLTGGSKNTGYLMSASYLTQDGLSLGDDKFERLNLRLKIDTDVTDWLTVGVNALISNRTDTSVITVTGSNVRGLPFFPVQSEDGLWVGNGSSANSNHVADAGSGSFDTTDLDRVNLQLFAQLKPVKGLTIEERVSIIKTNSLRRDWDNIYDIVTFDASDPDSYTNPDSANRTYINGLTQDRRLSLTSFTGKTIRSLTSATYDFEKGKHAAKAFAAIQTETGEDEAFQAARTGFFFDNILSLSLGDIADADVGNSTGNAETRNGNETTLSYIGRLNYSFDDKYLIEAAFRADGSSYFLESNQWAYFPSVAVGWVASKENFLSNANFISLLKFRASIGQAGDDGGLGAVTQQLVNFSAGGYPIGGTIGSSLNVATFVNPDLVWETSTITNIGVDASLFGGKFQFELDYFDNKRKDILSNIEGTAYEYGFGDAQGNPYDLQSWGWELNLTHKNKIGDFGYRVSGNISSYDNKITRIQEDSTDPDFQVGLSANNRLGYVTDGFFDDANEVAANVSSDGATLIDQSGVGGSDVGDFKFVDQLTVDTDGDGTMDASDGIINGDDRIIIDSNSDTNFNFGFNLGFSYKNLSLSARFYGALDNNQYLNTTNASQPFLGDAVPFSYQTDVWSSTNTNALYPALTTTGPLQDWNLGVDHLIIDAEYIKLQNITLNYDFGQDILSKISFIKSMNLYVSAENLGVIWTNSPLYDSGWDPELGVSAVQYPLPFTTAVGLNIKF
ncbi:TonB-linked outer membrane protein, SusC/RagA family [Algibacter lectus]|uniref:SusC/RagA family TonB-linked outer membrane protein n=1 Tax=Algibacter lectus TaxID=221126 RepID=UPI0008F244FD|nr:SusC/RagA family TonB-linked outer membrane protein [Algibacter lectus]SFD52611.1 TonB-linked outer membrane protein, SusC/RagA family [Algibacter lectus]